MKSYKIEPPVLLFLVSHQFLYQQISFFCNFFRTSFNVILKLFLSKVLLFNGFTQTSHPMNSHNLLSVTNFFCQFSLKCILILFRYLLTKSYKSIFYVSAVNCYCTYVSKGSNYRFSGVLFKTCFKNSYFNTIISNYL